MGMTLSNSERRRMEQAIRKLLDYSTVEDFLEQFDITPEEAILQLYEAGQLDPDKFEEICYDEEHSEE